MKRSKLRNDEELVAQAQVQHESAGNVFNNPEEMLRFDAASVAPPEALLPRLRATLGNEGLPSRPSWWQRIFGRGRE